MKLIYPHLYAFCWVVTCVALAGLHEGLFILTQADEAPTHLGGVSLALSVPPSLFLALLLTFLLPPFWNHVKPVHWWHSQVKASDNIDTEGRIQWSATLLSQLLALVIIGAIAGLAGGLAHSFSRKDLTMAFVAAGAMGGGVAAWVGFIALRSYLVAFFRRICPRARMVGIPLALIPVCLIALCIVGAAIFISGLDLGAHRLDRYTAYVIALTLSIFLFAPTLKSPMFIRAVVHVFAIGIIGWSAYFFSQDRDWSTLTGPIIKQGGVSKLMLDRLRALSDQDGDGFSAKYDHGDCDDANPNIHPMAIEILDNDVDENCQGGPGRSGPPRRSQPVFVTENQANASEDEDVIKPRAEPTPYNVVFILIDTLRPDHLGLYGYERETSPNLDTFSESALVFEHAFAHAPNTPRSIPSIFMGTYPSRIKWVKRYANYGKLKDENESVFELFKAKGWRTEAVSAHWYFEKAKGIKDGVDKWDNSGFLSVKESNTQSAAPLITRKLMKRLDVLETQKEPFFVFAHYFDPHGRYMNHPEVKVFGKRGLKNKYDSEIAFTDHHMKPVLDRLSSEEHREKTIVVITSDHGEAFKERGFLFHGRTVYNEEIKVPLLLRIPGVTAQRLETAVGLVDLLPTLGELVGIRTKDSWGESLVGLWTGRAPMPESPVFMEQLPYPNYKAHIVAAVDRNTRMKVVRNRKDNLWEVFDLKADPGERKNLRSKDRDAGKDVKQKLEQFIDGDPG